MPEKPTDRLLQELEQHRYRFGRAESARTAQIMNELAARKFTDSASLVRFHEALMFVRAFPPSPRVMYKAEGLLNSFGKRVDHLRQTGVDMDELDPLEISGLAGTKMQDTLSFDAARWLVRHIPGRVQIDWDNYQEDLAMGNTW